MRNRPAAPLAVAVSALTAGVLTAGALMTPTATSAGQGLTITVVNHTSDFADSEVFVLAQAGGTEVVADPQPLSARNSFTVASVRSGRVFISLGAPLPAVGEPSPDTSPVRYDAVELTYPGVANLTAVDMFGMPLDLEVFDAEGNLVGEKRWACYTDVVREQLSASLAAAGGDPDKTLRTDADGRFLRLVSPTIVSGLHPSGYTRFDAYLDSLAGVPLRVRGHALGQDYDYVGAFRTDPDDADGPGLLTLVDRGPDHLQPIDVTGASLVGNGSNATNGIYGNNSPYLVGGRPHSGNDVYAAAYRDLVAGFAYGFWGSPEYGNDSSRFDVAADPGPFAGAQPSAAHYNVWAAALWPLTAAYGFPYGDTFNDSPERNPIVELPTDGTLRITVQPDISPDSCAAAAGPSPAPAPTRTPTPSASDVPGTSPGEGTEPGAGPRPRAGGPSGPARFRTVPGRPGRPKIRRKHQGRSVALSWSAAADRDSGAVAYVVLAKLRSRCTTVALTSRTRAATRVRKSWRGRSVAFRVLGRNSVGAGRPSAVARARFARAQTARAPWRTPGSRPCSSAGW